MNDSSVPPIKDHAMTLAHSRLKDHPGMFEMLVHKLATGSPNAAKILNCVPHWEWVQAVQQSRDFSSIDPRILAAIDAWISSKPTSRSFVWQPEPIEYLTTQEKFARLDMHIAAYSARGAMKPIAPKPSPTVFVTDGNMVKHEAPATVIRVKPATWHLHEPIRDDGLAQPLYIKLKEYRDAGKKIPAPKQVLADWAMSPPPDITEVTKTGLKYVPTGKGRGSEDIPGLKKRIYKLTHPQPPKKTDL